MADLFEDAAEFLKSLPPQSVTQDGNSMRTFPLTHYLELQQQATETAAARHPHRAIRRVCLSFRPCCKDEIRVDLWARDFNGEYDHHDRTVDLDQVSTVMFGGFEGNDRTTINQGTVDAD